MPTKPDDCPVCHGVLKFIREYEDNTFNRKYRCLRCKAIIGSPTDYALCEKFGIIAKDTVINPCLLCQFFKDEKTRCQHIERKILPEELELEKIGGTGKKRLILSKR